MPTTHDEATASLLDELRELSRDVSGDEELRARRLAVLRRLEGRGSTGDRPATLLIA